MVWHYEWRRRSAALRNAPLSNLAPCSGATTLPVFPWPRIWSPTKCGFGRTGPNYIDPMAEDYVDFWELEKTNPNCIGLEIGAGSGNRLSAYLGFSQRVRPRKHRLTLQFDSHFLRRTAFTTSAGSSGNPAPHHRPQRYVSKRPIADIRFQWQIARGGVSDGATVL